MEFQMTIQAKERLSPRKAAILLTVCSVEAIEKGSDLTNYLALHFLLELNRTFVHHANTNLDATKKALALAEATMIALHGMNWVSITDRIKLSEKQVTLLSSLPWYPSVRTFRSWSEFYEPQKLLELKIVPLEQFQEHSDNTQPYVSYCKGYHESGKGYRRDGYVYGVGKTPFDPEIDEDREAKPVDLSSPIDEDPVYKSLLASISRAKQRMQKSTE